MKPINGIYYHRQMMSKPNIVPLFNILLVIFFLLFTVPWQTNRGCSKGGSYELPDIRNVTYYEKDDELIMIYINDKNRVWYGCSDLLDLSGLTRRIEDYMEENKVEDPKVAIKCHKDTNCGKVQHVLKLIGDAGVQKVSLMANKLDVTSE